jgi:hypothetical protein
VKDLKIDSSTEKQVSSFTHPHRAELWKGIVSSPHKPHVAPVAGAAAPVE